MIAHIKGFIIAKTDSTVIVVPAGTSLGYEIVSPVDRHGSLQIGTEVDWFIWHRITADTQTLLGFADVATRGLALSFAQAHGVGPVLAHRVATSLSLTQITTLLTRGDDGKALSSAVRGLGPSKASALVAAMKGKLADLAIPADDRLESVLSGLAALGFTVKSRAAVTKYVASYPGLAVEALVIAIARGAADA